MLESGLHPLSKQVPDPAVSFGLKEVPIRPGACQLMASATSDPSGGTGVAGGNPEQAIFEVFCVKKW